MPEIILQVKVIPNARTNCVEQEIKQPDGTILLKIRTQSVPEDGKANASVIEILSQHFKVKKNQIEITHGEKSRQKRVKIIF